MRPEIQRLLKQADRDLDNARKNLHAHEVAAFLGQQAVEKYLTGAWVVMKREPAPHTHALTELGDTLGVRAAPSPADLTSDYTVSRYPDAANAVPYELYDELTARTKVENAEAVIAWLRRTIAS
jgi:HEPN domain-containing protein